MDLAILLFFAGTLFAAAITPGPGVAALLARIFGQGMRGTPVFVIGMICGDLFWFTLAITGLAAIATSYAVVFVVLKWVGAAYLLYVAWGMWNAKGVAPTQADAVAVNASSRMTALLAGLSMNLSNPKVVIFYLALMPNIVPMEKINLLAYWELAATMACVLFSVFGIYAYLAVSAKKLMSSQKAFQRLNKGSSMVMVGVAATMVTR
ncbi:Homoserine/homoserine lactone efflux protein [Pseudovibrio axinellae]|uniref:Homoserine/homoserine lactone efflux protein n=1 Tax=Pseudovibrio axinellae TaxID=989403 RepID=A0A165Z562_9HYPH|nr:LysE family translocator [Pseudovibrio axinellae]KZL19519.1 Homoserine/homoserine lactone efflux protein [Pseudovibrio axinellae]SEQ30208.1 Threonine/homoserine/homoserine lactone efflux protein [Pseudovibrio axinellae]